MTKSEDFVLKYYFGKIKVTYTNSKVLKCPILTVLKDQIPGCANKLSTK